MGLNKQKGNMFDWCTHTWNPIKGECFHDCKYCYVKIFKHKRTDLRFVEKELVNLGEHNTIFIGSSTDIFSEVVPMEWIERVMQHCKMYPGNQYFFQSKNPYRMNLFTLSFPKNSIAATTIESNRDLSHISKAPHPKERKFWLIAMSRVMPVVVTIEPILDFDLDVMLKWMNEIMPEWINIGADSKRHNLPEPERKKVLDLIKGLSEMGIKVKLKTNLKRITKEG